MENFAVNMFIVIVFVFCLLYNIWIRRIRYMDDFYYLTNRNGLKQLLFSCEKYADKKYSVKFLVSIFFFLKFQFIYLYMNLNLRRNAFMRLIIYSSFILECLNHIRDSATHQKQTKTDIRFK